MAFEGLKGELPLGVDGLTGNKNLTQITVGSLLQADNITFESGTIQKEGGASKYNSTAITGAPSIIGGWDWFPTLGTQRMVVVTSGGAILKDTGDGSFGTSLATGLTVSSVVPVFVEGGGETFSANRKLFIFTKSNQVKVLAADGSSVANITTPAADWSSSFPVTGCIHEGRLWAALKHRVYYSLTTDHEDFTSSGVGQINVFPGEGEEIRALLSFKGVLIVWKYPFGIYLIDTSDSTVANWRVTRHSSRIGIAGPACVAAIDDDVVFVDIYGHIQLLSAVQEFGNFGNKNLSHPQKIDVYTRDNYNISRMSNARVVYYTNKNEVHVSCSSIGSSVNNRRLVLDLSRPDLARFRESTRDTLESLWLRQNSDGILVPVGGDNAGFVWLLDQETRSKDSSGYNAVFQTPHYDFSHIDPGLAFKKKNGAFLELVVEPKGDWSLSIDVMWDGELYETLSFNMGSTGAVIGSFVLGTDELATERIEYVKQILNGSGRTLSLIGRQSGAAEDFSIGKAYVYFTESTED